MKRSFLIAALCAAAAGVALHFLYDVLPNPLTALISPVRESVWEHGKLLFYPTIAAAFALSRSTGHRRALFGAFFAVSLAQPIALYAAYYLLAAFGAEGLWLDIALYFSAMSAGFWLAERLMRRREIERHVGTLLAAVLLYALLLSVFSYAAPNAPVFLAP